MIRWSDTFWGDGNRGFEVLLTNFKNNGIVIDEFSRFLGDSLKYELAYSNNLSRIHGFLSKSQTTSTFSPIWQIIRDLLEKIVQAHSATVGVYQELQREIHTYQETYQKKVRSVTTKDSDISRTSDLITQLNNSYNAANRAKEQYHSICVDYERARRSGNNFNNGSSTPMPMDNTSTSSSLAQSALNTLTSSTRQSERLEKKYRQNQDEYRTSVEKYNSIRNEFEKRFYDACNKFQEFENEHVEKMLNFALNYSDILKRNNDQLRIAQNDFHEKLKNVTGTALIEIFVESRKTGSEHPVALQFEEAENFKGNFPSNHSSSVTPDLTQGFSDELINLDQSDFPMPNFQTHFPVSTSSISSAWPSTTSMKKSDSNRALPSSTSLGQQQCQISNQSVSPLQQITSMSLSNPNNPLSRLQGTSTDQTSNPFDVKIRRPGFKAFWPTGRKEKGKKDKKINKKGTDNDKSPKIASNQEGIRSQDIGDYPFNDDESELNSTRNNNNPLGPLSNLPMGKCPTPEPYTQSSSPMPNKGSNRPVCQSTIPFPSSADRKSTSSSNSSDDDDDDGFPLSKLHFTIRSQEQKTPIVEENDEAKISNAMQLVGKSIGYSATQSRPVARRSVDMSKSVSSGQIKSVIPPPLPSRPTSTLVTSMTADHFPPPSAFPTPSNEIGLINNDDPFNPRRKSLTNTALHQENIPPFPLHPRSMTITADSKSHSNFDEDTELMKTFPDENRNGSSSAMARPNRGPKSMQPTISSTAPTIAQGRTTPFIGSISQSFTNGLMNSLDQRTSPITIGATDQIPIAVAFQETIHVMMSGDDQSKWKIRILGDMLISFPAAILNLLVDPSPHLNALEFRLKNLARVENVIANPQLVTPNPPINDAEGPIYSFNMSALSNVLRNLQEKNRSLPFFNFGILKYEVKHSGVSSIPVLVTSQWTRTFESISVQINYRFNSSTFPPSIRMVDDTVIFSTNISDGLEIEHSSPNADWIINDRKVSWKVPYTFDGSGKLTATIKTSQMNNDGSDNEQQQQQQQQQQQPLTTSSIINVRFLAENALFSSIDFDFACRGYRISLLKKKIQSGKYQSEPDSHGPLQLFKRPSVEQGRVSLSTPLVV